MSDHFQTSYNADSPDLRGSVLGGILGGIVGMFVCILIILLCCLFQISFAILFQLFTGLVIGWFYRLFHGQRSKPVAYVIVCVCTVLTCILWPITFALLSAGISSVSFTAEDWMGLWSIAWSLLLLCAGLGLTGFFFTRRNLLIYVDWKRAPGISHTQEAMALYIICSLKNFLPKTRRYPLPYIAVLHREPVF